MLELDPLEVGLALETAHDGLAHHPHVRVGVDAPDQVARHGLLERRTPHDDRHAAALLGQVERGLPGGVPAADHDHLEARAALGLERRRRVVDAGTLEPLELGQRQPAVVRAGGDDDRPGRDLAAVGEHHGVERRARPQPGHLARGVDAGAQPAGLQGGAVGQLAAREPVGEPDVVLDQRARAGLAAGGDRVERHGVEALGGPVHGRGQPGRAAAHDDEVERVAGRCLEGQAEVFGQLAGGDTRQRDVGEHDRRDVAGAAQPEPRDHDLGVVGLVEVDPGVGHPRAGDERPQGQRLGREPRAVDAHRLGGRAGAQVLAAGGRRLEDHRRQVAPLAHQPPELVGRDVEHPPRALGPRRQVGALAAQQADAPHELARLQHTDRDLGLDVGAHDLDRAVEHHVEPVGPAAGLQQHLAVGHVSLDAVRRELGDGVGVPRGEAGGGQTRGVGHGRLLRTAGGERSRLSAAERGRDRRTSPVTRPRILRAARRPHATEGGRGRMSRAAVDPGPRRSYQG